MKHVFMYTLSTCPWCRKAKAYFTDRNIPFQYVDYDLQAAEEQERIEQEITKSGAQMSFPWVRIGNDLVVGWNPTKYDELMGLSKASRP
jgi:glutaredoxin